MSEASVQRWARRSIFCGLLVMDFTGFACYSVMGPFFPTEAQRKGVTQTTTGLIFSSYALTVLIFSSIWGHAISRSSPKHFVVLGGAVCGLANIAFGFLARIEDGVLFTVACFGVRITEALAFAALNTGIFATMGRLYPESLGSAMAVVEISIGIGSGVGPALGSALYTVAGYPGPFVTLGCGLLVASMVVYTLITTIPFVESEIFGPSKAETSLTLGKFVKIPTALVTLLTVFSCGCSFTVLMPILAIHVQDIGIDETTSGYMFSAELGVYALVAMFVGKMSDRLPKLRFRMIVSGLCLQALGLAVIGPSPLFSILRLPITNSVASNLVGLVLLGTGGAFVLVPSYPVLFDAAQEAGYNDGIATHGIVGGAWNSFYTSGDMTGPASGAALAEHTSFRLATTVFSLAQFGFAAGTMLFLACRNTRSRRRKGEGPQLTTYNAADTSNLPSHERSPLLHGAAEPKKAY